MPYRNGTITPMVDAGTRLHDSLDPVPSRYTSNRSLLKERNDTCLNFEHSTDNS